MRVSVHQKTWVRMLIGSLFKIAHIETIQMFINSRMKK